MVRLLDWIVEEHHQAVTREPLQRAAEFRDPDAERLVVAAEDVEDVLGRRRLAERREAAKVREHDGDLAPVAGQQALARLARDQRGDLGREEPGQLGPLALDGRGQAGQTRGPGSPGRRTGPRGRSRRPCTARARRGTRSITPTTTPSRSMGTPRSVRNPPRRCASAYWYSGSARASGMCTGRPSSTVRPVHVARLGTMGWARLNATTSVGAPTSATWWYRPSSSSR